VADQTRPEHGETSSASESPTSGAASDGAETSTPAELPTPPPDDAEAEDARPETVTQHVGLFARRRRARGSESPPWDPATPKLELLVKKEKTRSNEYRLAVLSQVGALIVAAIAAASGWAVGYQHDKQEMARDQASFLRSEQRDQYVTFINSAADLGISLQNKVAEIAGRYNPSIKLEFILESKADLVASYTNLSHAMNSVLLLGSPKVRGAAEDVFTAANQSANHVEEWEARYPANGPTPPSCPEIVDFINDDYLKFGANLSSAIDLFGAAAREDLNIRYLPPITFPPGTQIDKAICRR
jgi:hypothetical protein